MNNESVNNLWDLVVAYKFLQKAPQRRFPAQASMHLLPAAASLRRWGNGSVC